MPVASFSLLICIGVRPARRASFRWRMPA